MRRGREKENKRHMPNENAGLRVPEKSDTSIIIIYSIIISRNLLRSFHWHIRPSTPSTQTSFPLFPFLALYFPSPSTVHMYPVEYDLWELNC